MKITFRKKTLVRFSLCFLVFSIVIIGLLMWYTTKKHRKEETHKKLSQFDSRPHLVLGVLTPHTNINFRDGQRTTWISTIRLLHDELPFRITYKFLVDKPTNDTILENKKYDDIVFLNVTSVGRGVRFGEKLYVWIKYIHEKYPDASLGAKLDDDVFLCVPQVFQRIDQFKSPTLYYGWSHGTGCSVDIDKRVDEMFVVLGKDLIGRIAKRRYCVGEKCKPSVDLIDTDYGGTSIGSWLSIYNDVDHQPDNYRIVQFGRNHEQEMLENIKENFCSRYVLNHKSPVEVMKQLHEYNKPGATLQTGYVGAVTGKLFSGDVVRTPFQRILTSNKTPVGISDNMPTCNNWAVVTTIFSPSKAVQYIASLSNWCLVIVADTTTPSEETYLPDIVTTTADLKRIKYLSVKEQIALYPLLSDVISTKHFGRKNIGYIYAIHHKANVIWDFDDDNYGTVDLNDFKSDIPFPHATVCSGAQSILWNPYPYFGVTETHTWPRGFPLQDIKNITTVPVICKSSDSVTLGVVQSLANEQPDIDAIYRMTRDAPFNFSATRKSHRPFVLPRNTFAPINAQATLWLAPAFPYMALPISVNGRVSDIWRGYIAQYFFHKKDIRVAFSSPYVIQERNAHNILRDFNAELDLYQKCEQLIYFLSSKDSTTISDLVDMYKELYARQYIEQFDIQFAEAWTQTLANITTSL
ncbi:uncharacterized protein LOC132554453 [Ylistrum balloti]|uniref:uncharacterized protein LOC132554453 n=1 Tax=Ylistrum balloti TaxID=509963 RepID=UPI002905C682|nr:uncharacterized protein LOC132554453 [Ylistrum balloti]